MTALPADTRRFRAQREEEWRRLEDIVVRAEKGSVRRLSDEDLLELPFEHGPGLRRPPGAMSSSRSPPPAAVIAPFCVGIRRREASPFAAVARVGSMSAAAKANGSGALAPLAGGGRRQRRRCRAPRSPLRVPAAVRHPGAATWHGARRHAGRVGAGGTYRHAGAARDCGRLVRVAPQENGRSQGQLRADSRPRWHPRSDR